MALPKIKHPTFDVYVSTQGKNFKFRPFTVKEEKLLLLVKTEEESKDYSKKVTDTIKQIIVNCCVDEKELDVENLAVFDFENIFVNLRKNSVGNIIELTIMKAGEEFRSSIDLNDVKLTDKVTSVKKNIDLLNGVGVVVRWPTFKDVEVIGSDNPNSYIDLLSNLIEKVYDENNTYDAKPDELKEFVEDLPRSEVEKILDYISSMPTISLTAVFTNKDSSKTHEIELKGLSDFFQ